MSLFYTDLLALTEQWIKERQLKSNTVRSYRVEISRLTDWLVAHKKVNSYDDLRRASLAEFLKWIAESRANKAAAPNLFVANEASLNQTRRIARAFLLWVASQKGLPLSASWNDADLPASEQRSTPKNPVLASVLLPKAACDILLANHGPTTFEAARDVLMANMAFWCCATTSELASLLVDEMQIRRGAIDIRFSGENARQVCLPPHLDALARNYLHRRQKQKSTGPVDYLFVEEVSALPLKSWTIRRRVAAACASDQTHELTPQKLRRAFIETCSPLSISGRDTAYRSGNHAIRMAASSHDLDAAALNSVVIALKDREAIAALSE